MNLHLNTKNPLLCDYVKELAWHERAFNIDKGIYMKRAYRMDLLRFSKIGGIYGYYNVNTKQYYIGLTNDFYGRFVEHLTSDNPTPFDIALRDNWKDFTYGILEVCDKEIRDYREKLYIEYYDSKENGYNSNCGNCTKIDREEQYLLNILDYCHNEKFVKYKDLPYITRKESQKIAREKTNSLALLYGIDNKNLVQNNNKKIFCF